jgi:hypothetical protein
VGAPWHWWIGFLLLIVVAELIASFAVWHGTPTD